VIVVASVSCIFGLGSPEAYRDRVLSIARGETIDRRDLLLSLSDMQYARNEMDFQRGNFRVKGDVIEVYPAYEQYAIRIELFGDDIDRIEFIHPATGEVLAEETQAFIFPAVHYVLPDEQLQTALQSIQHRTGRARDGPAPRGQTARGAAAAVAHALRPGDDRGGGLLLGHRELRRQLEGRRPAAAQADARLLPPRAPASPTTGWFIDESHATIPQVRAMYNGDRSASRCWWTTASGCRARWTTGR
jgi:excinuclease ABC subunit B